MKTMAQKAHDEVVQAKQQLQQMQKSAVEKYEQFTKQTLHQSMDQQKKIDKVCSYIELRCRLWSLFHYKIVRFRGTLRKPSDCCPPIPLHCSTLPLKLPLHRLLSKLTLLPPHLVWPYHQNTLIEQSLVFVRKRGKIRWANLSQFSRALQKFFREYKRLLSSKHFWPRQCEGISAKTLVGLKP